MLPSLQRLHGLRRPSLDVEPTGVEPDDALAAAVERLSVGGDGAAAMVDVETLEKATEYDGALAVGTTYLATRHSSTCKWVQIVFTCVEAYDLKTNPFGANKIKVASVKSSKGGECSYRDRIARAVNAGKDVYFLHGAFWVKGPDDYTIHDFFNARFRWTLYRMA